MSGRTPLRVVLCALLIVAGAVGGTTARADEPLVDEDTQRSREAFELGRQLYYAGKYPESIRVFEAGYALAQRPLFLVNIAQAYRRLRELDKSRAYYQRFLDTAPSDDPQRPSVERLVAEIDKSLAEQKAAVVVVPPPPAVVLVAPAPPPPTRGARARTWIKHHAWVIPVAVVGAAGLAVGIYFAARPAPHVDCAAASAGWCVP